MATYIVLSTFTEQGIGTVRETTNRDEMKAVLVKMTQVKAAVPA